MRRASSGRAAAGRATLVLLALAACDANQPENIRAIEGDPIAPPRVASAAPAALSVAGPAVRIVGSSTVYPFATAVAETFKRVYPAAATPIVESTGTGGGIKLFCSGVGAAYPDIATASRRIKPSEVKDCRGNGVTEIVEVQVGVDGIVLAESREAPEVALDLKDVYRALAATAPEGGENRVRDWRQVDSTETSRRIEVLGPPPTSGTRDAFNELVMEGGCKAYPHLKALKDSDEDAYKARCTKVREDGPYVEAGENDNLLVQKLVANPNAFGVFGWSYLEENADKVKGVALGGVPPTYDNIASFRYPASRPLYIYVKAQHVRAKPAIRGYLAEFTKEAAWGPKGYLRRRGLIAAPTEVRARNAAAAANLTPLDPATLG
jgi:phosphate transport system substrate-binding protein